MELNQCQILLLLAPVHQPVARISQLLDIRIDHRQRLQEPLRVVMQPLHLLGSGLLQHALQRERAPLPLQDGACLLV